MEEQSSLRNWSPPRTKDDGLQWVEELSAKSGKKKMSRMQSLLRRPQRSCSKKAARHQQLSGCCPTGNAANNAPRNQLSFVVFQKR